jgi:hypothetical protein
MQIKKSGQSILKFFSTRKKIEKWDQKFQLKVSVESFSNYFGFEEEDEIRHASHKQFKRGSAVKQTKKRVLTSTIKLFTVVSNKNRSSLERFGMSVWHLSLIFEDKANGDP